jgi:hypothetical protein
MERQRLAFGWLRAETRAAWWIERRTYTVYELAHDALAECDSAAS